MNYCYRIALAALVVIACPAQARVELVPVPYAPAYYIEQAYLGFNCKKPEGLREFFRTSAWKNRAPEEDPGRLIDKILVEIGRVMHDPDACEFGLLFYRGSPEDAGLIVRSPTETYTIKRFDVDDGSGILSTMPEHRYGLQ